MTKLFLIGTFILATAAQAMAGVGNADAFYKRFTGERDAKGKLQFIRDRWIKPGFSLDPLIEQVKHDLQIEQTRPLEQSYAEIDTTIDDAKARSGAKKAVKAIHGVDLNNIFDNALMKNILKNYEQLLSEHVAFDVDVLAAPADNAFFYRKAVTHEIMVQALKFAAKQLNNAPILGVADYIIETAEKLVRERRTYHQNMLLYYLEKFKPEDLGLTHDEVMHVTSSIFESRLVALSYLDHTMARDMWDIYGGLMFDSMYRTAQENLEGYQNLKYYEKTGERVALPFLEVTEKGVHKIINLLDKKHEYSQKPAVAYYYDNPNLVAEKRLLCQVIQIGAHLLPLSSVGMQYIDEFAESSYANQRITEGWLVGYFEANADQKAVQTLYKQNMNPYDLLQ